MMMIFDDWIETEFHDQSGIDRIIINWIDFTIEGKNKYGSWKISTMDHKIIKFKLKKSADVSQEVEDYYNTVCPDSAPDIFLFSLLKDKKFQKMILKSPQDKKMLAE